MKNVAIQFERGNQMVVYLNARPRREGEDELQYRFAINHKCRVKQVLYGYIFTTYNPNMDFTLAKQGGFKQIT